MKTPVTKTPAAAHPLNPDNGLQIRHAHKTLRRITPKEAFKRQQYEMDFRFVREVERLEREGRVENRLVLETSIGMSRGEISAVRRGDRGVTLVNLKMLHELYRGDRDFVMYGIRNNELSAPYIPGIGRIDRYEGYIHRYSSTALWRCGPRPEADPAHYPPDPENKEWQDVGSRSQRTFGAK